MTTIAKKSSKKEQAFATAYAAGEAAARRILGIPQSGACREPTSHSWWGGRSGSTRPYWSAPTAGCRWDR